MCFLLSVFVWDDDGGAAAALEKLFQGLQTNLDFPNFQFDGTVLVLFAFC